MSDSVRPHRRQPTRLPRLWDSPGRNTGVGCHFLLQCMKVKSEREVAQSCLTLSDPMDPMDPMDYQAPPPMGFSRQEYWSGSPLPSPRNKASGGDGIPIELFQILKDDALKVLHSICQQIWKTQQWPQGW